MCQLRCSDQLLECAGGSGSSFATDALFLFLTGACDKIRVEHPQVRLCLFVGDLTIDALGSEDGVSEVLPAAVRSCIDKFEAGLQFRISRGRQRWKLDPLAKTTTVASSTPLMRRLEPSFREMGIGTQRHVKLLGVDYSAGGRVSRRVQRRRLADVASRQKRYRSLGKRAAAHLFRTGAVPGVRYGAGVFGVNKTTLKAVRRMACGLRGPTRGRCTSARLVLTKYDPGLVLATDAIFE